MRNVLIVCTANICRSPMGEGILKKLVSERPDADLWHIESAGTWAIDGNLPAPLSKLVMQERGIDISTHRSQPISEDLVKKFDLILTMERYHRDGLRHVFKKYAHRIYLISEMVGLEEDIQDPIGGELEDYLETANRLEKMLSDGLGEIYKKTLKSRD